MSVYRNENPEYFNESLLSIQNQTLQPKEVVIVKDGKINDKLQSVIDHYKSEFSCLKEVDLAHNSGLGVALNEGTKYISTDWIARMDSDDIAVKNRFEIQMKAIMETNVQLVGGQVKEFAHDIENVVGYRKVPLNKNEIFKFGKFRSPFNHPTIIINTSILKKIGGYVGFEKFEDYHLWGRIIRDNVDCCNLHESLVYMRTDGGMYARRGGLKYLKNYFKLRNLLNKWSVVNKNEELLGDLLMICNVVVPVRLRKTVYKLILHRK
jgi:glycosyltransferase involved in cell wall biosynthesis